MRKEPTENDSDRPYDSQMMVALIKENQDLKGKISEKEQLLEKLQEELALYEK